MIDARSTLQKQIIVMKNEKSFYTETGTIELPIDLDSKTKRGKNPNQFKQQNVNQNTTKR